jgi:hypothetical protein
MPCLVDSGSHKSGRIGLCLSVLILVACGPGTATATPSHAHTPSSAPSVSAAAVVSPTPATALVGKWELDRTCAAMVRALTEAKRPELIPIVISELVSGTAASFDPANPCADARPPSRHSHTFWPDGRFNSYDENEEEVDFGRWILVDGDTAKIGEPAPEAVFDFDVEGDKLSLTPVPPADCGTADCINTMGWQFSVAFPGETWTRATSGPHVP